MILLFQCLSLLYGGKAFTPSIIAKEIVCEGDRQRKYVSACVCVCVSLHLFLGVIVFECVRVHVRTYKLVGGCECLGLILCVCV